MHVCHITLSSIVFTGPSTVAVASTAFLDLDILTTGLSECPRDRCGSISFLSSCLSSLLSWQDVSIGRTLQCSCRCDGCAYVVSGPIYPKIWRWTSITPSQSRVRGKESRSRHEQEAHTWEATTILTVPKLFRLSIRVQSNEEIPAR